MVAIISDANQVGGVQTTTYIPDDCNACDIGKSLIPPRRLGCVLGPMEHLCSTYFEGTPHKGWLSHWKISAVVVAVFATVFPGPLGPGSFFQSTRRVRPFETSIT